MKISISKLKTNFSKYVNLLLEGNEEPLIVTKRGKPVAILDKYKAQQINRIGAAKDELKGFDISLEAFNSI